VIFIKDDIKEMANLLRAGYTMLNMSCPECNNPIFRNKEGELFCPTCKRKVIIKNNNFSQNNEKIKKMKYEDKRFEVNKENKINFDLDSLKVVIFEKINWIGHKLKSENQVDLIERYLKILLNFLDLLIKITNFND